MKNWRITRTDERLCYQFTEDDKWLSFKNHCRKERVSFIVYADLECILEKTDPSSHMCQHHRVFNVGYYVHCSYDDSLSMYQFRRNNNCIVWFTEQFRDLAHSVNCVLAANVPMVDFDNEKFNSATHCHVCDKPFG